MVEEIDMMVEWFDTVIKDMKETIEHTKYISKKAARSGLSERTGFYCGYMEGYKKILHFLERERGRYLRKKQKE